MAAALHLDNATSRRDIPSPENLEGELLFAWRRVWVMSLRLKLDRAIRERGRPGLPARAPRSG
jgi:hypothetical protein